MEREMKYEYAAKFFSKSGRCMGKSASHYDSLEECKDCNNLSIIGEVVKFVRRQVGEWEEVE